MKTMISDVDHGHRVTALESGFTGLGDLRDQHQNDFNSKLVNSLVSMFQKHFSSNSLLECRMQWIPK